MHIQTVPAYSHIIRWTIHWTVLGPDCKQIDHLPSHSLNIHFTSSIHLPPPHIQSPGASPHLVSPLRIKHYLRTAAGPRSCVPHPSHPGQSQSHPATTIIPTALAATTIAGLYSTAPTRHHLGAHALINLAVLLPSLIHSFTSHTAFYPDLRPATCIPHELLFPFQWRPRRPRIFVRRL